MPRGRSKLRQFLSGVRGKEVKDIMNATNPGQKSATFDLVLANIENSGSTLRMVRKYGRVLLINECKPQYNYIKRWSKWNSRFADTNAVIWQRENIEFVHRWRREILVEKGKLWQDSHAIATHLRVDGVDVLFVVTHFPSKAFTTMSWRRPGWYACRRNLIDFINDIQRNYPKLDGAAVIVGADFNRASRRWKLGNFTRRVGLVTYGSRGHYDQIFTRGPVVTAGSRARRLGSPHRTITTRVTVYAKS